MSIIGFRGSISQKDKTTASCPDFAGVLTIGPGIYNCAVWLNHSKKGRPYLGLRLTKQCLDSKDKLKLALWEKPTPGYFEARCDIAGQKFTFSAHLEQAATHLELCIRPVEDLVLLRQAIQRLPIPVLWQTLALSGTVRQHCCVRSPLRDGDRNPSFSIYDDGRRFKDHGTGVCGDAFEFFKLITQLDSKIAYKRFLELA